MALLARSHGNNRVVVSRKEWQYRSRDKQKVLAQEVGMLVKTGVYRQPPVNYHLFRYALLVPFAAVCVRLAGAAKEQAD